MPLRRLRGAFIGFGSVAAQAHLPGWQWRNDVSIVAAVDASAARREAFLAACPDGRCYDSFGDLLAVETLEFVDICTPPGSHAALTGQALDARLHVLCEKPLAIRAVDAAFVAAAAGSAGRIVHTVHNWLEAPICRMISALISEGAIGAVRSLRWRTLRTGPAGATAAGGTWRLDPAMAGGGILLDHGWHALYCAMRWAGGSPRRIAALLETRRFHDWALEDTATVTVDLGISIAHIHLSWAADERSNDIEVEGERGCLRVIGDCVVAEGSWGERRWSCPPPLFEGSYHPDWFAGVAEDFLAATAGSAAGNLDQAVLCARLIDLAKRSSAAGGVWVSFDA